MVFLDDESHLATRIYQRGAKGISSHPSFCADGWMDRWSRHIHQDPAGDARFVRASGCRKKKKVKEETFLFPRLSSD